MELSRVSKSGATDALERALELVSGSCAELRRLATALHPTGLEVLGLSHTLEDWVGRYQASAGVSIDLNLPPTPAKLPDSLEFAVFRLIQEGVDFIADAGGRAASVWLRSNRFRMRCVIEGRQLANSDVRHRVQFAALESRARRLGGTARYKTDRTL